MSAAQNFHAAPDGSPQEIAPEVIVVDGGAEFAAAGITMGFTTRHGGSSAGAYSSLNLGHHVADDPDAVAKNRAAVATWAQQPLQFAEQIHSNTVQVVEEVSAQLPTADALIAQHSPSGGRGLAIMVADCCPILVADPAHGLIAAIHAGRAGLMNGIVARTIDQLRALGASNLTAAIGPTICGACYEVPPKMAQAAYEVAPASASTTRWGTPGIDIAAGVAAQLHEAGAAVITSANFCTYEDSRFYSHRRAIHEQQHRRPENPGPVVTGRFAGVISIGPSH